MEQAGHHPRPTAGEGSWRARGVSARFVALLAGALLAPLSAVEVEGQRGGLFTAVAAPSSAVSGAGGTSSENDITIRRRLVAVDLGMLAGAAGATQEPGSTALTLNLFDDLVLTGIVEQRAPTFSGGYALMGRIEGIESGSMTLVVNGTVVAGSVRTPSATYRIRPVGASMHAVSQIDPSRLPEGAKPLTADPFEAEAFKAEPSGDGQPPFPSGRAGSRPPR